VDMNMPQLNLPHSDLKIKLVEETTQVFDEERKELSFWVDGSREDAKL
jgi:hypothetical protein